MLGHVAQSVGGALPGQFRRVNAPPLFYRYEGRASDTSFTFVAPEDGTVDIYATASGGVAGGNNNSAYGGGGGASGRSNAVEIKKEQRISILIAGVGSASANARDSTITLPSGTVLTFRSGRNGDNGRGLGGTASNFDLNSSGGRGGGPTDSSIGAGQQNGFPGENFGGAGGSFNSGSSRSGGGGGAGGFGQNSALYLPGNGVGPQTSIEAENVPGGGGIANNGGGAPGRVMIVFNRLV